MSLRNTTDGTKYSDNFSTFQIRKLSGWKDTSNRLINIRRRGMFGRRNLPSKHLLAKMVYLAIWGTIPWKGKRRWGGFDVQARRPGTRPRDILIFERRRRPASVRFRSVHRNQWFRRASGRRKSSCWRRTNVGPRLFRNTSPLTAVLDDFSTIVGWTDIKRI